MIDIDTPGTPGWWLAQAQDKLRARLPRLEMLNDYIEGNPPLPTGAPNARKAYEIFQKKSRLNLAELLMESLRERLKVRAITTAGGAAPGGTGTDQSSQVTEQGDALAWSIYKANGLDVELPDVLQHMLGLSDGYMVAGLEVDGEDKEVVITGEDPRQIVTFHDPVRQSRVIAAAKFWRDPISKWDYALLWLPAAPGEASGRRYVAARPLAAGSAGPLRFNARQWSWVKTQGDAEGEPTGIRKVPVVRFRNRNGVGEFERHIDVLDRINHMILQRMVIATMQAFRQRAIKGDMPRTYPEDHPRAGEDIDYDELFESDPGALWLLPASVDVWESGQVDLQGILSAVKDDIQNLAAVTRRPITILSPESANQSAEGASLTREGLTFAVEDRQMRAGQALAQIMSIAFELLGDLQRADLAKIDVGWFPPERFSLSAKGSAAAQAKQAGHSDDFILQHVWQLTPTEIAREKASKLAQIMMGLPMLPAAGAAPAADDTQPAAGEMPPDELRARSEALGQLIRAGVEPPEAARRAGLTGLTFTGATPVSLRPAGE